MHDIGRDRSRSSAAPATPTRWRRRSRPFGRAPVSASSPRALARSAGSCGRAAGSGGSPRPCRRPSSSCVRTNGTVDVVRLPKRPRITVEFYRPAGGALQRGRDAPPNSPTGCWPNCAPAPPVRSPDASARPPNCGPSGRHPVRSCVEHVSLLCSAGPLPGSRHAPGFDRAHRCRARGADPGRAGHSGGRRHRAVSHGTGRARPRPDRPLDHRHHRAGRRAARREPGLQARSVHAVDRRLRRRRRRLLGRERVRRRAPGRDLGGRRTAAGPLRRGLPRLRRRDRPHPGRARHRLAAGLPPRSVQREVPGRGRAGLGRHQRRGGAIAAQPSAGLSRQLPRQSVRMAHVGRVLGQRPSRGRGRVAGPLRPRLGARRRAFRGRPGRGRLRRHQRAVSRLPVPDLPGAAGRLPAVRRHRAVRFLQPGGRRDPGRRRPPHHLRRAERLLHPGRHHRVEVGRRRPARASPSTTTAAPRN